MEPKELKKILNKHLKWLEDNSTGKRADLSGADLSGADLSGADLSGADLSGADLSGADLRSANLRSADLSGADLSGADLSGANLRSANLRSANLRSADLSGADLSGADLSGANLSGANLSGAYLPNYSIIPEEGVFICYKKLKEDIIAKLEVPAKAKRTNSVVGRKCRAEFVKVLSMEEANGKKVKEAYDRHPGKVLYKVGKIIKADKWDDDIRVECTNGIHFFITKKEAKEY